MSDVTHASSIEDVTTTHSGGIYERINVLDVMSIDKIVKNWRSIYYNNRDIYNTETLESYFASLQNHNQEISPKFYLMLSQISTKEVYFIETDVPSRQ